MMMINAAKLHSIQIRLMLVMCILVVVLASFGYTTAPIVLSGFVFFIAGGYVMSLFYEESSQNLAGNLTEIVGASTTRAAINQTLDEWVQEPDPKRRVTQVFRIAKLVLGEEHYKLWLRKVTSSGFALPAIMRPLIREQMTVYGVETEYRSADPDATVQLRPRRAPAGDTDSTMRL